MSRQNAPGGYSGAHEISFEAPDLFVVRVRGDVVLADVEHMFAELRRLAAGADRVFWMTDIVQLGTISPDARKRAARSPEMPIEGAVICGGSLLQRMAATLALNASRLLRGSRPLKPVLFTTTEAEGRAWVAAQRARARAARVAV